MDYKQAVAALDGFHWTFVETMKEFFLKVETLEVNSQEFAMSYGKVVGAYSQFLTAVSNTVVDLADTFNFREEKNIKGDFESTLIGFVNVTMKYHDKMQEVMENKGGVASEITSPHAYYNIQKFFASFSTQETIGKMKKSFQDHKLDVSGFDEKFDIPQKDKAYMANEAEKARRHIALVKRRKVSIVVGATSIAAVFAIFIFVKPPYHPIFETALQVLFAIGAAGLSAALIGTISLKKNPTQPFDAYGGFAVFLLLLFFDIKLWKPPVPDDFTATIVLRNKKKEDIYGQDIKKVQMRFDDELKTGGSLEGSNGYFFKPVKAKYRDADVELLLGSPKWVFADFSQNDTIKLKEGINIIPVIRDSLSLEVYGPVLFNKKSKNGKKPNVIIYVKDIPDIRYEVDSLDFFRIRIPEDKDKGDVRLVILKNNKVYLEKTYEYGSQDILIEY